MLNCLPWNFLKRLRRKLKCSIPTYSTLKSSAMRELKWTPFVVPETRRGSRFVEAFGNKAGSKEIISKDTSLGKTVAALANFKVDPAIAVDQ